MGTDVRFCKWMYWEVKGGECDIVRDGPEPGGEGWRIICRFVPTPRARVYPLSFVLLNIPAP